MEPRNIYLLIGAGLAVLGLAVIAILSWQERRIMRELVELEARLAEARERRERARR